jgi:putative FmdB family regulatory protein
MPTHEYECGTCGLRFERRQAMSEEAAASCPECCGSVRRLISGGVGFILKSSGPDRAERNGGGCSLEHTGKTCCGRDERCGKPQCGDAS